MNTKLIINIEDTYEINSCRDIQLLLYNKDNKIILKESLNIGNIKEKTLFQEITTDNNLNSATLFHVWLLKDEKWSIIIRGEIEILYNDEEKSYIIYIDDKNILNKHFKDPNSLSQDDLVYINNKYNSTSSKIIFKTVDNTVNNNVKPVSPSIIEQSKSFTGSMADWAKSKFELVDNDTFLNRLSICKGCEFWNEMGFGKTGKCEKCGCSTQAKLRLPNEKCPLEPSKW
jgi:hypothetical protein